MDGGVNAGVPGVTGVAARPPPGGLGAVGVTSGEGGVSAGGLARGGVNAGGLAVGGPAGRGGDTPPAGGNWAAAGDHTRPPNRKIVAKA
jgi:hypothetical protein